MIRLQLYYQDLGQLKKCWPDGADQTLLANTTQVFFGVNDQQTAEYVSNRLGEETIIVADWGESKSWSDQGSGQGGRSSSYSRSCNLNHKQVGRKLLKPEEVAGLDPRVAITFTPGRPPIWTRLVRYYEGGWNNAGDLSPMQMIRDTACVFLSAAALAAMWTAAMFYHVFR
jgi:type IV secretion system protein VirD4